MLVVVGVDGSVELYQLIRLDLNRAVSGGVTLGLRADRVEVHAEQPLHLLWGLPVAESWRLRGRVHPVEEFPQVLKDRLHRQRGNAENSAVFVLLGPLLRRQSPLFRARRSLSAIRGNPAGR